MEHCGSFQTYGGPGPFEWPGANAAAAAKWTELLGCPEIDLLVLAAPYSDRVALSRAARSAGKAVLLEEGPPLSLTEIDQLTEDDRCSAVPLGLVMPLRGLLALDHAVVDVPWTQTACGGLVVSQFSPASGRAGPEEDTALKPEPWPVRAVLGTIAPYLDLACQLFGTPVAGHLDGAGAGSAVGVVEFESGARLSLAITVRSTVEETQLKIMDTHRTVTLQGWHLWLEDADGIALHRIPPLHDLRLSSYREMALALRTGASASRHSPTSARGLARCLTLLKG
ncbi:hypothetical protein [Streptomyces sp. NPDC050355]|uniref:hypothetical protein n=1 Tax=Streptomyces sp. NPDC050355 TaxID=3365609 RepID=UPI0037A1C6F7